MLTVLGEMENSSQILDFMFLGSEWNAANRTELIQNGITHILNITKEIDNFYPGMILTRERAKMIIFAPVRVILALSRPNVSDSGLFWPFHLTKSFLNTP